MTIWTQAWADEQVRKWGPAPEVPHEQGGEIADEGPESKLQGKIVKWCKDWGRPCLSFPRTPSVRRFLPAGWPDVCIIQPGGVVIWLELKEHTGKPSPEQKLLHLQFMALGHTVSVVKSFRRFLEIVREK